ncbi:hypothetical protein BDY21DRAFT_148987 [Lineolata rhizophorae]|uniref:Uncharacterized protein n=1 Tax=Lineolata rhizophorae TaxID=578093 RepID=A0A6A6NMT0_9PEZI|nr:hypothetical protein BDY21DRAFT_148987 [Lineolata rhizophorae]
MPAPKFRPTYPSPSAPGTTNKALANGPYTHQSPRTPHHPGVYRAPQSERSHLHTTQGTQAPSPVRFGAARAGRRAGRGRGRGRERPSRLAVLAEEVRGKLLPVAEECTQVDDRRLWTWVRDFCGRVCG